MSLLLKRDSLTARLRGATALLALFVTALSSVGCQTGGALSASDKPPDPLAHITRVTYSRGDNGTVVKVYGSRRFEHTSYKLSDPLRIAIEIPNVVLDFVPKRVNLNESSITHLNVVRFDKVKSVRIELELIADVPFKITQKQRYLEVLVSDSSTSKAAERISAAAKMAGSGGLEQDRLQGDVLNSMKSEIETLTQDNFETRKARVEAEEENNSLKLQLEEAHRQLEEATALTRTMEERIDFMAKKLSEIQEKIARQMPELSAGGTAGAFAAAPLPTPIRSASGEGGDDRQETVEINEMVNGWLEAWNQKDLQAYSAYYSDDFRAGNLSRKWWMGDKKVKFARDGDIEVTAQNLKVTVEMEEAVVLFEQRYQSQAYRDNGLKIMKLTKKDGSWKIVSESWKPL